MTSLQPDREPEFLQAFPGFRLAASLANALLGLKI
jgi:hypothetical protein